ncbi:uncharacterized protein LOC121864064 [Homarus americanus]|uniref:uncharacterized protein LOC121864064 n=1 Tax=Homarus americanus TaxID=6706 RepID=UPI001C48094A|nr:uncharacterized protein LOC121864064 [Homarus americanus]
MTPVYKPLARRPALSNWVVPVLNVCCIAAYNNYFFYDLKTEYDQAIYAIVPIDDSKNKSQSNLKEEIPFLMMASSAIYQSPYQSPSVRSPPRWNWLGNSHQLESSLLKQLHQQKTSSLQQKLPRGKNLSLQYYKLYVQPKNQLGISRSRSSELQKQTNDNNTYSLCTDKSPKNERLGGNLHKDPNKTEAVKRVLSSEIHPAVDKTSSPLTSGLPSHTNFEKRRKEDLLQTSIKTNMPTPHLSLQSSLKPLHSKGMSHKKQKFPSGQMPKTLMCYLCQKNIKEDRFVKHLFFGPVKCLKCNKEVQDCHSFKLLCTKTSMEETTCDHKLQYCSNPFDYISLRLSGEFGCNGFGSLYSSNVLKDLSVYIDKLGIVEMKDPWRTAILQCKKLLPTAVSKSSENAKLSPHAHPNSLEHQTTDTTQMPNLTPLLENNQRGGKKLLVAQNIESRQESYLQANKQICNSSNINEDEDIGDLLLSQTYGLEQLEQAIEYVQVHGHGAAESHKEAELLLKPLKKKRGPRGPYKKRKTPKEKLKPIVAGQNHQRKEKLKPLVIGKDTEPEEDLSTEYIETPANGYYYVVRHAIEECPMCYKILCPSRFTVNVETFLMTTICIGCDLTIYIVPELPDGSTPGVSIVTEEEFKNPPQSLAGTEGKKRKYAKPGRPRKSVKPQNISHFIA